MPRTPPAAPALQLTIVEPQLHPGVPGRATLRRWVTMALQAGAAGNAPPAGATAQIALVFCDARAARRLNREFRGRDYATNVLTFSYQVRPEPMADIVLCMPVVRREARTQRKPVRDHLAHLVFHGVLHALGHDHLQAAQTATMQAIERALLGRLRIPDPYASG